MSWDEKVFKEKLEGVHSFPCLYIFKFIVKPEFQRKVEKLIDEADIKVKSSSGNKYVSITLSAIMKSSEKVIAVYKEAKQIEKIIFL